MKNITERRSSQAWFWITTKTWVESIAKINICQHTKSREPKAAYGTKKFFADSSIALCLTVLYCTAPNTNFHIDNSELRWLNHYWKLTATRTIGQKTFTVRQQNCTTKKTDRPVVEGEHFPAHSQAKRGRCWWCFHKKRVTTRSVWMCQECKVNLCIIGCFRDYHKPDPDV